MESTCIVANGCAMTHQALFRQSDPSEWVRCLQCGLYNEKGRTDCRMCKSTNVQDVEVPYCFKLLQSELLQCGIMTK